MYRPYQRNFITLKQERNDFTLSERNALGTVVMEIRGSTVKLHASLQHLSPDRSYQLRLAAAGQQTALCVAVGRFDMQPSGKGEARCQLDGDDIADTGLPIEDFNVFLVTSGNDQDFKVPLVGYRDQTVSWKDKLIFFEKQQAQSKSQTKAQKPVNEPEPAALQPSQAPAEAEEKTEMKPGMEFQIDMDSGSELKMEQEQEAEPAPKDVVTSLTPSDITSEAVDTMEDTDKAEDPDGFHLMMEQEPERIQQQERGQDQDQYQNQNQTQAGGLTQERPQIHEQPETTNPQAYTENQSRAGKQQKPNTNPTSGAETGAASAPDFHTAFKAMAQKFQQELNELNAYTALTEEEMKAHHITNEDIMPEPMNLYATGDEKEITRIFSQNESVSPFNHQKRDVDWVRISLDELPVLPCDFMKYMNSPLVLSGYYQYKHLLLGRVRNTGGPGLPSLILGIPDHYDYAYKVIASELEFRQFKPCEGEELRNGVFGYWLMVM